MTQHALDVLLAPQPILTDPQARTWWPALVVAVLVACAYEALTARGRRGWLRRGLLVSGATHPTSRVDLKLVFVRAAVRVFVVAALPLSARFVAVKTVMLGYAIQDRPPFVLEGTTLVVVYSACLFLASDFSRYALHRLGHEVGFLWRFHQVHHSAEVLTPLTLYRIHPVEQVLQALRGVLVVGGVAGVFAWLSFGSASAWTLYGVPGGMLLFNLCGANLRHSGVWLAYPSVVEHLLISPAQHQIHHDVCPERQQQNYGATLAVWDWAGGSLCFSKEGRPEALGLAPEDQNHDPHSLLSTVVGPFYRRVNRDAPAR